MNSMVFFWQFAEHLHQKMDTLGTNCGIRFLRIPEFKAIYVRLADTKFLSVIKNYIYIHLRQFLCST
jgi:hypothetical protein